MMNENGDYVCACGAPCSEDEAYCDGCMGHTDDWDNEEMGEDMDGDHESGLASAGWGTDEDYGDTDAGCYYDDVY